MPLHPKISLEPFEKWGINFIRPIDPPSRGYHHILVYTNYVTKWTKVRALPIAREDKVVDFMYKQTLQRFGAPREIVFDQGPHFMSSMMEAFMQKYRMTHRKSFLYHPQ